MTEAPRLPDELYAKIIQHTDFETLRSSICLVSRAFYDLAVAYGPKDDVSLKVQDHDSRVISCFNQQDDTRLSDEFHQVTLAKFDENLASLTRFKAFHTLEWTISNPNNKAKAKTVSFKAAALHEVLWKHKRLGDIKRIQFKGSLKKAAQIAEFEEFLSLFARPGTLVDLKECGIVNVTKLLQTLDDRKLVLKRMRAIIAANELEPLTKAITETPHRFSSDLIVNIEVKTSPLGQSRKILEAFAKKLKSMESLVLESFNVNDSGLKRAQHMAEFYQVGDQRDLGYFCTFTPFESFLITRKSFVEVFHILTSPAEVDPQVKEINEYLNAGNQRFGLPILREYSDDSDESDDDEGELDDEDPFALYRMRR